MAIANFSGLFFADFELSANLDAVDGGRIGHLDGWFPGVACCRLGDHGQADCAEKKESWKRTCHGRECLVMMRGSSPGFWGLPVAKAASRAGSIPDFHYSEICMRAPLQKAAAPRIRALDGASARARGGARRGAAVKSGAVSPAAAGHVFREFVATLDRLDKARRRKSGAEGSSGPTGGEG